MAGALSLVTAADADAGGFDGSSMVKVAPAPHAPTIGPITPTWCDELGAGLRPEGLSRLTSNTEFRSSIDSGIALTCVEPDNAKFQQQLGYYLQLWANETGADTALLKRLMTLYSERSKMEQLRNETCQKFPSRRDDGPRAESIRAFERATLGCEGGPQGISPGKVYSQYGLWAIDRTEAFPSQLAGLGYLAGCLSGGAATTEDARLADWAACRVEANLVDASQLTKELKDRGLNEYGRVMAELALSYVRYAGARRDEAIDNRISGDADRKAVWVDAPAKAWKAWQAQYAANKSALDAANDYEDKVQAGKGKGCLAQVEGIGKSLRGSSPAKTPQEVVERATAGVGPVLLVHLYRCLMAEGHEAAALGIAGFASLSTPARGPRVAVQFAMLAAATAAGDEGGRKFSVYSSQYATPDPLLGYGRGEYRPGDHFGVVKSVKADGDRMVITFKTVAWEEKEQECTPTKRIIQWRPDGTPMFAENCRYTGRTIKRTDSSYPFWTAKALMAGIKPGVFIRYTTGAKYDGKVFDGYPVEVWSDKNQKKLLAVMGVPAQ